MSKQAIFSKPVKKQTMAEQMAETIQESILSGELESGAVLPTEPELAEQFGVSRAVVRDATRILMARGLVEVQHGRGVFVTQAENEAFGEALLLALRRVGASAWDVEQFEQILFPEVIALAAGSASDERRAVPAMRNLPIYDAWPRSIWKSWPTTRRRGGVKSLPRLSWSDFWLATSRS